MDYREAVTLVSRFCWSGPVTTGQEVRMRVTWAEMVRSILELELSALAAICGR